MVAQSIQEGDGFILVYSVDSMESFLSIQNYRDQILNFKENNVPMVLLCNKNDLGDFDRLREKGQDLAKKLKIPFFITSAKNHMSVEEAFNELLLIINKKYFKMKKTNSKKVVGSRKGGRVDIEHPDNNCKCVLL